MLAVRNSDVLGHVEALLLYLGKVALFADLPDRDEGLQEGHFFLSLAYELDELDLVLPVLMCRVLSLPVARVLLVLFLICISVHIFQIYISVHLDIILFQVGKELYWVRLVRVHYVSIVRVVSLLALTMFKSCRLALVEFRLVILLREFF